MDVARLINDLCRLAGSFRTQQAVMAGPSRQKFTPDDFRVLTQSGNWTVDPLLPRAHRRRRRHADRSARRADRDPAQMRMLRQELPVVDACEGDIGSFELL